MGLIGEEVADRLQKEKELLKVKIRKEDVDLLVRKLIPFIQSQFRSQCKISPHSTQAASPHSQF